MTVNTNLICDKQGAEMLNCSVSTWWRRVADGTFPKPIKIGSLSRWRFNEIEDAIAKAAEQREAA